MKKQTAIQIGIVILCIVIGIVITYSRRGSIETGTFLNGTKWETHRDAEHRMHGHHREWNTDGVLLMDDLFDHGQRISGKGWYPSGRLRYEVKDGTNFLPILIQYPDQD